MTMFRFFLVLPLFLILSFSWSCGLCKSRQECEDSRGYGITEIELRIPMFHDLKFGQSSPFRIVFSSQGKTLECPFSEASSVKDCFGTIHEKKIGFERQFYKIEQKIYIIAGFFYRELHFFIEHDGVVLFDGKIDFSKKPNKWRWDVDPDACSSCLHFGFAYATSNIVD
jgi:hypothetical protein